MKTKVMATAVLAAAMMVGAGRACAGLLGDHFTNGDPYSNDGTGLDWEAADQSTPWSAHQESSSSLTLFDGASNWSIGGIKSLDTYAVGQTFRVVLTGIAWTSGTDVNVSGSGLADRESVSLTVSDRRNTEAYPSSYCNAGLAALAVDIGLAPSNSGWEWDGPSVNRLGWSVHASDMANWSSTCLAAGVFDANADALSAGNPLTVEITPKADGSCTIGFGWSYSGGRTDPVDARLSSSGIGRLSDGLFRIGIGAQGIGNNNGSATFDAAQVVPEPATMGVLAVGGLFALARRRRRAWPSA